MKRLLVLALLILSVSPALAAGPTFSPWPGAPIRPTPPPPSGSQLVQPAHVSLVDATGREIGPLVDVNPFPLVAMFIKGKGMLIGWPTDSASFYYEAPDCSGPPLTTPGRRLIAPPGYTIYEGDSAVTPRLIVPGSISSILGCGHFGAGAAAMLLVPAVPIVNLYDLFPPPWTLVFTPAVE
jgi:hypothetical protein